MGSREVTYQARLEVVKSWGVMGRIAACCGVLGCIGVRRGVLGCAGMCCCALRCDGVCWGVMGVLGCVGCVRCVGCVGGAGYVGCVGCVGRDGCAGCAVVRWGVLQYAYNYVLGVLGALGLLGCAGACCGVLSVVGVGELGWGDGRVGWVCLGRCIEAPANGFNSIALGHAIVPRPLGSLRPPACSPRCSIITRVVNSLLLSTCADSSATSSFHIVATFGRSEFANSST